MFGFFSKDLLVLILLSHKFRSLVIVVVSILFCDLSAIFIGNVTFLTFEYPSHFPTDKGIPVYNSP